MLKLTKPPAVIGAGLVCCVLLLLAGARPVVAQDAPTAPPAGSAAELVERLDTVSRRVAAINDYLRKPAPDLAGIAVALPGRAQEAQSVLGTVEAGDSGEADLVEMTAALQRLRNLDRIFDKWRQRLKTEVAVLDPWREQLRDDATYLRAVANPPGAAADALESDLLSAAVRARLTDLADELEATRKPLLRRLDVIVDADVRVGQLQTSLRDLQAQLDAARLQRQEQPLTITAAPLWNVPDKLGPPVRVARQNFTTLLDGVNDYLDTRPAQITAFCLTLVALLVAILRLRRSIMARGETEADDLLTQHPVTVALLVWTLIGPILFLPDMPLGLTLLRGFLSVVLLWRLLPVLVAPAEVRPVKGLLLLAAAFQVQLVVLGDDWYGRIVTVLLGLTALLVFRDLARRSAGEAGGRALFRRAIHGVAVAAPVAVAIGLVAEVAGARALSTQAIGGIVFVTLALCSLLAVDIILRTLLDAWVSGPGARWLRGVRNAPESIRSWGRRLIRLVLVLALINLLPTILPILEPLWNGVGRFLGTPVTAGNLDLSLGDVLWFFIGIAIALGVARFVRFVLDEDVLSRMPLAMGAASAASRLIYYALVVVGILFALAASGVELSKLTLIISALGVGIGFGLQNIVNNFVSGLILAFERPVREGDQITLGTTTGRVDMIGLRATRIRTFEGAEVIVPNANLISGELTNWTLSDRARRIEITIGVDYDSDPVRVQEVLLESIRDLPGLAAQPVPTTAFRSFGASSLDFSLLLWTRDVDDRLSVESDARLRVLNALRESGIDIPFPRMDLRVRDRAPGAAPVHAPVQAPSGPAG